MKTNVCALNPEIHWWGGAYVHLDTHQRYRLQVGKHGSSVEATLLLQRSSYTLDLVSSLCGGRCKKKKCVWLKLSTFFPLFFSSPFHASIAPPAAWAWYCHPTVKTTFRQTWAMLYYNCNVSIQTLNCLQRKRHFAAVSFPRHRLQQYSVFVLWQCSCAVAISLGSQAWI